MSFVQDSNHQRVNWPGICNNWIKNYQARRLSYQPKPWADNTETLMLPMSKKPYSLIVYNTFSSSNQLVTKLSALRKLWLASELSRSSWATRRWVMTRTCTISLRLHFTYLMTLDNNMMGLEHGNVEVFDKSLSRVCLNLRHGNSAWRGTLYSMVQQPRILPRLICTNQVSFFCYNLGLPSITP